MKELLAALADYNRGANQSLITILRTMDAAVLQEDVGVYYKSIIGTLRHIESAQLGWLRRFPGFFPAPCLAGQRLIEDDFEDVKTLINGEPSGLYAVIAESDALMADFVKEAAAGHLSARVAFTNASGKNFERPYWHFIFHVLNHATHHRGELSAVLDQKGITNDFAGLMTHI